MDKTRQMIGFVFLAGLLLATLWRWTLNQQTPRSDAPWGRQVLLDLIDGNLHLRNMPEQGIRIQPLYYDPNAEVLIGVGPDGQPGTINVDDERNGVVDDAGEMGAVGSDDECVGPLHKNYTSVQYDPRSIVVSLGAFRSETDADAPPDRYMLSGSTPTGRSLQQLIIP